MKTSFKRIGAMGLSIAVLAGVTTQAHAQATIPRPTPPAQPLIPAGLVVGARSIDRQDVGEFYALHGIAQPWPAILTPSYSARNAANVSAYYQGRRGRVTRSYAPLWVDSAQATKVSVSLGESALALDAIRAADDVVSVTVHDEQGNTVTDSQRAYRHAGSVESLDVTVRVDEAGRLLPLATVRLSEGQDGTVTATRDSGFAEPLVVVYRFTQAQANAAVYIAVQTVTIPAGAASAKLTIPQPQAGDTLTLKAGNGYTPNPDESSDRILFAAKD